MTAIPVSQLVSVTPAVQAPGGSNLVATGLLLTNSTMTNGGPRFPVGSVLSFSSQAAVGTYAGTSSTEYALAGNYFAGYDNSLKKPASLLIATVAYGGALPAYLRSSSFGNATFVSSPIASGALTLVIDGATFAATGINLTGQTSYSGVASTVQTALQAAQPTSASATGSTISATTFTVGTIVSVLDAPAGFDTVICAEPEIG